MWQISRGGVIITTAIFSKIFLKKTFAKAGILGCVLAFVGITLVQVFEIVIPDDEENYSISPRTGEHLVGIGLLLVALLFNTITFITEKIIFNKY